MILRISITIEFLGSLIRMYTFVNGLFWPIFLGHMIQALTGPIYLTCTNIVVNTWYADTERGRVTTVISMGVAVGNAACFALAAFWLNQDYNMREFLWRMMLTENIVFFITVMSMYFLFKDKPDIPPTPVAEAKVQTLNFFETFRVLKDNANFRYLLIAFGLA